MTSASSKRVVLALSSYHGPFYPDGLKTGAYFSEVYHPFQVYTDKGFKVDLVSETGTFGWDEHSIGEDALSKDDKAALNDKSNEFHQALGALQKASSVDPEDYDIFYAAGGHATIFDFVGKAPGVASLAGKIWDNGGIVAAVCHGPVILGDIKDKSGKLIAKGRKVTGFSEAGEEIVGLAKHIEENHWRTVPDVVASISTYVEPQPPFQETVVIDDRLATGANPASATALAKATLNILSVS